jgi:hypothetical protein
MWALVGLPLPGMTTLRTPWSCKASSTPCLPYPRPAVTVRGLQLDGGLGGVVGDHPPDLAAAVLVMIGALGFVDLRPDGRIGRR